jgi:hypothetical protein
MLSQTSFPSATVDDEMVVIAETGVSIISVGPEYLPKLAMLHLRQNDTAFDDIPS